MSARADGEFPCPWHGACFGLIVNPGLPEKAIMKALVVYFSKYGQTETIAEHIAAAIGGCGVKVAIANVTDRKADNSIDEFDVIILGSPIYATNHSKQIREFVDRHRVTLRRKTSGFFSVSLSAAGNDMQRQDAIDCMNEFLDQCDWKPDHIEVFAGSLPYRKYNWFVRWMMKRISKKAGGDTDTSRDFEYTDWDRVSEFATKFVQYNAKLSTRH